MGSAQIAPAVGAPKLPISRRIHSSLTGCPCPTCDGTLQVQPVQDYQFTTEDGAEHLVACGMVNVCADCGLELVTEAEWEEWLKEVGLHG